MIIQVLLAKRQYCLSKKEAKDLLDQTVHVVTIYQGFRHVTNNFVKIEHTVLFHGNMT